MNKLRIIALLSCVLLIQGCVHKLVTVPVGVAYGVTKGVAKSAVFVGKAIIPDGDDDEDESD